ncbi:MAG: hypothetical protein JXB49_30375 [Bacteroidales bacterium]|nr:hypothetical protein [Bacteroidales bacterium]
MYNNILKFFKVNVPKKIAIFSVAIISLLIITEICLSISKYLLSKDKTIFEYDYKKEKIIFCIGDSFTYGQGLSREDSYPMLLQKLLGKNGINNIEVVNLGIPGSSSSYALYSVASIIKECTKPSIMLVLTGWNANNNDFQLDIEETNRQVSLRNKINNVLSNLKTYRFFMHLLTIKDRQIILDDIKLVPMSEEMSLYNFKSYQEICMKNLEKIVAISKNSNSELLLLNYPNQDLPKNPYNLKDEYYHLIFGRTPLQKSDFLITNRKEDDIAINSIIELGTLQIP